MRFHLLVLSLVGLTLGLSAAQVRTHITTGGTLPTNCTVGDVWYKTGASAGFYTCSATDTWTAVGGSGGTALSAITAATGSNTIASGNNHSQIWNWALTSNTVSALTLGETTAATSGTNDAQSILKLSTLATSTAVDLLIDCFNTTSAPSCVRVNDVSGDTTPFTITADGAVRINVAPDTSTSYMLKVGSSGASSVVSFAQADGTLGDFSGPSWGTISNNMLYIGTNGTKYARISNTSPQVLYLSKSAQTSLTSTSNYLNLGEIEDALNAYYLIGFGYTNNRNNGDSNIPPTYLGYQEISNAGSTNGDLIFGTRSVTTGTTAPSERMRILADGTVNILDLKTTGSAGSKNVVCVDTATGKLYASSTGTDCSN